MQAWIQQFSLFLFFSKSVNVLIKRSVKSSIKDLVGVWLNTVAHSGLLLCRDMHPLTSCSLSTDFYMKLFLCEINELRKLSMW